VIPTTESRTIEEESYEEMEESSTTIFPNPFENSLEINFHELPVNSTILIQDVSGRVVYETKNVDAPSVLKINTSTWAQGIYFLRQNEHSYKLIKQ
jgi:hypothetical protein